MATSEALDYVQERADGALRGFAEYHDTAIDIHHVRDDIKQEYGMEELRARFEEISANVCRPGGLEANLGPQYAGLRLYQDVVIVHIPPTQSRDGRGLILTMDRSIGRNLTRFLQQTADLWRD